MASPLEEIKIALNITDANASAVVKKLESSFRGLAKSATQLDTQGISKVRDRIKNLDTVGKRNISTIQSQIGALKALRNEAQIGSSQFKQLTADIAKYSQELQKAEGRKRTGGRFAGAAKSVGAIAAAGVFGGPEGAIGAGIGAFAGPQGALVGGAIGAQVGQIRQALGGTAEYAANLQKLRIALKGVTTSQAEYARGLDFIQKTTQDFAIPQDVVTRQFTKLQASVQGAGGNLDDTKTAFNGIVAAVRATGGSLSDVDAALTATAQVFSKGKVSAEELRQQIGERLPGAFTLFAESMGLTPAELDKALEQGKVSLQDFQGFAKAIFDRYGKNAQQIAKSPKAAGDQLQVQLQQLQESVGRLLQPIGAFFQQTFGEIVREITKATNALARFMNLSFDPDKLAKAEAAVAKETALIATLGEGPTRRRAERRLRRARQNVATQVRLRDASAVDVQQPDANLGGLPGIEDLEGGGGAVGSKMQTASQDLLDLAIKRNAAVLDRNAIRVAELDLQIATQKIAERFNAGEIDFNKAKILDLQAQERFVETGLKLREQEKKALADLSKGQKDYKTELTETQKLFESIKDTVATGMANAITSLIDGTKSLAESLSGILKQLGSMFLQFGMKTLVGSIFPTPITPSARGNVFAENGIVPYANGGIISRPTRALMGEAGPEAVLPLQRGADGQLGVQVTGEAGMRAAMGRYSRRGGTTGAAAAAEAGVTEFGGVGGSGGIDVRYNVERINSVDYVTAEQFQVGLQRAAQQGAAEGERRAMGSLRNSAAVRRRIGV